MAVDTLIKAVGDKWNEIQNYLFGDFSGCSLSQKSELSARVRTLCANTAALVAPQPLPFADIWIITLYLELTRQRHLHLPIIALMR